MTLIVGFKCRDGYVLASDSQETVGDYRVARLKLDPWQSSNFSIAMAGSGNYGELIDSFEQRLKDNLAATQIQSLDALKEFVEHELADFRKTEARLYRGGQQLRFLIGAQSISQSQCVLWSTKASRLSPVKDYAVVGFEDQRYEYAAKSLYRSDSTMLQGVFLGLYVMWLAEQTSNSVKSPVTVALLNNGGISSEKPARIDALLNRVKLFSAQFDSIFLACADTGLQPGEFSAKLRDFVETIVSLRRDYVEESVGQMVEEGLDRVADTINLVPTGTTVVTVPMDGKALKGLQEMQRRATEFVMKDCPEVQEVGRVISNLKVLRDWQTKALNGEATVIDAELNNALTEINRAAMAAPFKLDAKSHEMVYRVMSAMPSSIEEHANERLRKASIALRIAVIDQALAIIETPTPSVAQKSEGQQ